MNVNKEYYSILYVKDVTDNRTILSRVKNHFFCDKSKAVNSIILYGNGKLFKDEKKVAKTLNDYFINLTKK